MDLKNNIFVTGFFGWNNIKFVIRELIKMYSGEPSFFSKKRIESGIAFIVMEYGMVHYLVINIHKMTMQDLFIWASINGAICGYQLSKIQSEKKDNAVLNAANTTASNASASAAANASSASATSASPSAQPTNPSDLG